MTEQALERAVVALDGARRAGWARAYAAEEQREALDGLAVLLCGYVLGMQRTLLDGNAAEARAMLRRCLARLLVSEDGRALIDRTLAANSYLADWLRAAAADAAGE